MRTSTALGFAIGLVLVGLCAAAFFLQGCASFEPKTAYAPVGGLASIDAVDRDFAECYHEAQLHAGGDPNPFSAAFRARELTDGCMALRGYRRRS